MSAYTRARPHARPACPGSAAVGRKAAPGPLYGISRDVWSALAIAVTYAIRSETLGPA